jgi:serine/threonine-protein kinase SRPK3
VRVVTNQGRDQKHVALKILTNKGLCEEQDMKNEIKIYQRLRESDCDHIGSGHIRPLLGAFEIHGPDGLHHCLVHPPLYESMEKMCHRTGNPVPTYMMAVIAERLFLALDFLHTECHVAHTGTERRF